ncbi:MAG: L-threonylcarbamoyladenylate synthase [Bacteroidales bacterium]|jgi:L-threonylcarbamoyladenylate synthase
MNSLLEKKNQIIAETIEALKKGQIILYPTDTIWGIGCDATNSKAVDKIYKIKKRPNKKKAIILVSDEEMLLEYIEYIPPTALDLIQSVRNPISVIYPEAKNLPSNVISEDKSIGIRVVRHNFCKEIIKGLGKPIISTSANISGNPTPKFYYEINKVIFDSVDYIVDRMMEETVVVKPSTIVKFNKNNEFEIIRK